MRLTKPDIPEVANMLDNLPPRTHNNPPDPLDEALAPHLDFIAEAEGWLDGKPVENEAQMKAVDVIAKAIRSARSAVKAARESATAPLHDAWKAEIARWKPTEDDLDRIQKGLAGLVDGFKRKLAAERAEAERRACEELAAAQRAAEEARQKALVSDIEAQREAAEAQRRAEEAQIEARKAAKANDVKGMRTVTKWAYEADPAADPRGARRPALNWIAANDPDALTAFIDGYVDRHHKVAAIAGVKVWQERVAY